MSTKAKLNPCVVPAISRSSYLELESMFSERSPLRGFITLFWVVMGTFVLQTMLLSWRSTGWFFGFTTLNIMTKNFVALVISDIAMLLCSSFCFPFQILISKGLIPSRKFQLTIQAIYEVTFLTFFSYWTYSRDWYIIQRSALMLHIMVSFMKMHSYNSTNQHFFQKRTEYTTAKQQAPDSKLDFEAEAALKMPFSAPNHSYPNNLTLSNYIDFLLVPCLVYQLEYPRNERFRPGYFFEKVLALAGTVGLSYMSVEHYLIPTFDSAAELTLPELVIKLMIPFTIMHLLLFYILFEVVCNSFAELTRYADRNFYDDWWNSHNFLEYSSKWNKPVHKFLQKHVYHSLIETFSLRKRVALILTFLYSSVLHELVMLVVFKKFIMVFFMFQMAQIPLICLMQLNFIVSRPWLGNAIFWIGICSGIPILSLFYART